MINVVNRIDILPKNVAVLTRGRVHSDTDIVGLWKSKEIELFAEAVYEWKFGSRKKAYSEVARASYNMLFNEDVDDYIMNQKLHKYTDEDTWKNYIIDILLDSPDIEKGIGEWVKEFSSVFQAVCDKYGYEISKYKKIKDIFK